MKNFFEHSVVTKKSLGIVILGTLLVIGFFLRFANIEHIPAGLYPDEAMNGVDALRAIETGEFQWFYPNNNGREGLFINLQALAIMLFGATIPALKFFSALFGTLTILGVFLLAKELWHQRSVALFSAFLVTFSYWGINFSRIGFRAIMVPFLLSFSFWLFFRGLRTKKLRDFFLAGLVFGLGFHTYIAFRVAPLILILLAIGGYFSYKHFFALFWKPALVFVFAMTITVLPIALTFFEHTEYLSSRSASISIFSPEVNHGNLPLTFLKTLSLSVIKYTFVGDQNWRHNYPPYPLLDFISGTLFLCGFVFLIMRLFLLARRRFENDDRNRELLIALFLLGGFAVMLLPEFLTEEGLPHALRAIGTLPFVFLIASMPLLFFAEWLKTRRVGSKVGILFLAGAFLAAIPIWNTAKYFFFFAKNPNAHGAFNENFTRMASVINELPDTMHIYVLPNAGGTMIDNGLPITAQPIVFLTHDRKKDRVTFLENDTPITTPATILFQARDDTLTEKIIHAFPNAVITPVFSEGTRDEIFRIITIETSEREKGSRE